MFSTLTTFLTRLRSGYEVGTSRRLNPELQNRSKGSKRRYRPAFTIVELLIVIVVIAILATIVVVAFNGVQRNAAVAALQSELKQASTKLELAKVDSNDGNYPASLSAVGVTDTETTAFQYTRTTNPKAYCITATTTSQQNVPPYHISSTNQEPTEGLCEGHTDPGSGGGGDTIVDGSFIQDITAANCPAERTRAVDARDNHTYWVQKITGSGGYSQCWMLTNLAYAGGGTNTYGDVKTINHSTSGVSYTEPRYYIPSGANVTTEPAAPSTSTDGTGQYGYLYNWCAAMGAPTDPRTSACNSAATPAPDTSRSICPTGWRLPTGEPATGEFTLLNNAVNGGLTNTDAGLLTGWLAQRGGAWFNSTFYYLGTRGNYWAATQHSATVAHLLLFISSSVINPAVDHTKNYGFAVRCLTN